MIVSIMVLSIFCHLKSENNVEAFLAQVVVFSALPDFNSTIEQVDHNDVGKLAV